jgi:hypothetical protein
MILGPKRFGQNVFHPSRFQHGAGGAPSDNTRSWGRRLFIRYYFLAGIAAGITVIIASHDPKVEEAADLVFEMKDGELV